MLADIEYWRDAPLWDPDSIAEATKTWFTYLGRRMAKVARCWNRLTRYRHKIKTPQELREIIGPRPRQKTRHHVPRRLRHRASRPRPALLYAKSKADMLIASLTADRHIVKGNYRPHVPQDLRAFNLAAFEMVDYVIIDNERRRRSRIFGIIQPDYFAKGYEYTASGMPTRTARGDRRRRKPTAARYLHARRHRLFVVAAHRIWRRPMLKSKSCMTLMERCGRHLRRAARDARQLAGTARPRRRRHHRRQLHPLRHDRRPDQDADHERAVRAHGSTMSAAPAIVAKHLACGRRRRDVLDRARRRQLTATSCIDDLESAGIDVHADHRPNAADDQQERHRRRRLPAAQGRHARQPLDLRRHRRSDRARRSRNTPTDAVVFSDFRHGIFNRRTIPRR